MLTAVVSPYDVSARSVACFGAVLLCDRVVTLLPAPHEGTDPEAIRSAVEESPRFLEFMESWRWSRALWQAGLISTTDGAATLLEDIEAVCERIEHDDTFAPLHGLVHAAVLEETRSYLNVLCRDLMTGGGDPRTSVPVSAAAERFAARRRALLFRPEITSLAGRIETTSIQPVCAFSMPILAAASGEHCINLRRLLTEQLTAVQEGFEQVLENPPGRRAGVPEAMREPLREYDACFHEYYDELVGSRGEDEFRARAIHASFNVGMLPADSTLRAAAKAAHVLRRGRTSRQRSVAALQTSALGAASAITVTVRETSIRVRG